MRCENEFCIYEEGGWCTLHCVELDGQGQCKECVYVDIPKTLLQQCKKRQLDAVRSQEKTGNL